MSVHSGSFEGGCEWFLRPLKRADDARYCIFSPGSRRGASVFRPLRGLVEDAYVSPPWRPSVRSGLGTATTGAGRTGCLAKHEWRGADNTDASLKRSDSRTCRFFMHRLICRFRRFEGLAKELWKAGVEARPRRAHRMLRL